MKNRLCLFVRKNKIYVLQFENLVPRQTSAVITLKVIVGRCTRMHCICAIFYIYEYRLGLAKHRLHYSTK